MVPAASGSGPRTSMTMVTHVTRAQLPKPLAAVHRCAVDGAPMFSANERFDLGRLVVLGCPGNLKIRRRTK